METFDLLKFRPFAPGDMEQVRVWRNSPAVARHMVSDRQIGPEEHRRWFLRVIDDPESHYFMISYLGRDAGVMYVYDVDEANRRCYVGDYIGDPALQRHKGIGAFIAYAFCSFSFDDLQMHKVCCEILRSNAGSLNLHRRFFTEEGVLRQHVRKGDRWDDLHVLGVLREEWEALAPPLAERLRKLAERLRAKDGG